jgi:hypothetical protein
MGKGGEWRELGDAALRDVEPLKSLEGGKGANVDEGLCSAKVERSQAGVVAKGAEIGQVGTGLKVE